MEVIYAYSRAQALADGVLVDASELGREAGIVYPIALTSEVWSRYVAVPEDVSCQDETGRLWDILWMFQLAARHSAESTFYFELMVRNDDVKAERVQLKAVCGSGDNREFVVTIMLPNED